MSIIALAVGGCREDIRNDILCPAAIYPGIEVTVKDSRTGQSIADGAVGVAREGAYLDSLRAASFQGTTVLSLAGALGRAGTYTVTVERSGYVTWTKSNVDVERGACGVVTTHLTANLVPSP
ncbi:MAG: hypothetical protein ABIS03_02890 [Gemmatimonadaceae bacterium]